MKSTLCIAVAALLGLSGSVWGAGIVCLGCGVHCITPPPATCPDCTAPCERGLHFCSCWRSQHAQNLIEQLSSEDSCERVKAARRLGSRLHADFCCDPDVLTALIHALLCDPCWEVRKTAAWGIAGQNARTDAGVMALYLASKLDPHYLVRDAANDALGVLLVCRRDCFKDVFARGDAYVKALKGKYHPGSPDCASLVEECLGGCGVAPAVPSAAPVAKPQKAEAGTTVELQPVPAQR